MSLPGTIAAASATSPAAEGTRLSVIVASYNSAGTLERCLESILSQLPAGAEAIVSDCSSPDPCPRLRKLFPEVRFLHSDELLTIPELRCKALPFASGDVIAFTEGRLVPSAAWLAGLLKMHRDAPGWPAVGGPIDHDPRSVFDSAVFFCEYGLHMPPTRQRIAPELSGANLSYKRWVLEACADLVESAAWEPFFHLRLKGGGHQLLRAEDAVVVYRNSLSMKQFLRQRFHYGRGFAAARSERTCALRRLMFAVGSPALPFLLTLRLGRLVFGREHWRTAFLRALPWVFSFQCVWSAGELCGYLFGKGNRVRRVF